MVAAGPGDLVAVQGLAGLRSPRNSIREQVWLQSSGYRARAQKRGGRKATASTATVSDERSRDLEVLGGARAILATAPSSKAMSELIDGLGPNGNLWWLAVALIPS